jgi:hypothetical protein
MAIGGKKSARDGRPPGSCRRLAGTIQVAQRHLIAKIAFHNHGHLVGLLDQRGTFHLPIEDPAETGANEEQHDQAQQREPQQQATSHEWSNVSDDAPDGSWPL